MNIPEFMVSRWEAEQPAFRKVLAAVPEGKLDYTPHERSTPAGNLAWQLVVEQQQLSDVIDTGEVRFALPPVPATIAEMLKAWDAATDKLRERLKTVDDEKSGRPAKMYMGDQVVWTDTIGNMIWGFLVDMIHHRGQLSTYLRPMGGKVPAIYGPSGDDKGE